MSNAAKVRCLHDKMLQVGELNPHPKNHNKHSQAQIAQLGKIIEYQGWRHAITVSNQSGFMTKGHGRLMAAKLMGWTEVPVVFQDYDDGEQEYADVQADNAIALQAELDLDAIKLDLVDLQLDPELLGIKEIDLDPLDVKSGGFPELPEGDKSDFGQVTFTLHKDQLELLEQALNVSKSLGEFENSINENSNGNALARICHLFLTGENADS